MRTSRGGPKQVVETIEYTLGGDGEAGGTAGLKVVQRLRGGGQMQRLCDDEGEPVPTMEAILDAYAVDKKAMLYDEEC